MKFNTLQGCKIVKAKTGRTLSIFCYIAITVSSFILFTFLQFYKNI